MENSIIIDKMDVDNRYEELINESKTELLETMQMHNSEHSTTSTDNTDIFILGVNESHYADKQNENNQFLHSGVETSFTVLNAPLSKSGIVKNLVHEDNLKRVSSDEIDESTEVLLVIRSEDKIPVKSCISGTDSDVEVLMSEEIVDSDWSAGTNDELRFENCIKSNKFEKNLLRGSETKLSKSVSVASIKHKCGSSTDRDILSLEEFSKTSLMGSYERLTRKELLKIMKEQATRIEQLEEQINRYRLLQQTFFDYVTDLKQQLDDVTKDHSTN